MNNKNFKLGDRVVATAFKDESSIGISRGERMTVIDIKTSRVVEGTQIIKVRFDRPQKLDDEYIITWWLSDEDLDIVKRL